MVLEPKDKHLTNAKGTALIYKVQLRPPSMARTNISILGVHLPSDLLMEITIVMKDLRIYLMKLVGVLDSILLKKRDSPTWAGRFDEITAKIENVEYRCAFLIQRLKNWDLRNNKEY